MLPGKAFPDMKSAVWNSSDDFGFCKGEERWKGFDFVFVELPSGVKWGGWSRWGQWPLTASEPIWERPNITSMIITKSQVCCRVWGLRTNNFWGVDHWIRVQRIRLISRQFLIWELKRVYLKYQLNLSISRGIWDTPKSDTSPTTGHVAKVNMWQLCAISGHRECFYAIAMCHKCRIHSDH